jgi:hypothetical protein
MEAVVKNTAPPRSVEWEGNTYLPGETIPDLSAKEAERLYRLGLIESPQKEKKGSGKGGAGKSGEKGPGKDGDEDKGGGGSE